MPVPAGYGQEEATQTSQPESQPQSQDLEQARRPHGRHLGTKAGDRGSLTRGISEAWKTVQRERASGFIRHRYMTHLKFFITVKEKATSLEEARRRGFIRVKDKSEALTDVEKGKVKNALADLTVHGWNGTGFRGNVAEWIAQEHLNGLRSSIQVTAYLREVLREVATMQQPAVASPDDLVLQHDAEIADEDDEEESIDISSWGS